MFVSNLPIQFKWRAKMKLRNVFLAAVVICTVLLDGCSGNSAIETYMTKDIEDIGVEKNLDEAGTKMGEILGDCTDKINNDEEVDWDTVDLQIEPVLASMQETRDKIAQIRITDENVEVINSYLISTYDNLISGYRKLIEGLKAEDGDVINEATDILAKAEEDIQTWYALIEAAYKD